MGRLQTQVRHLRKNQTPAEQILWGELRQYRLKGFAFRRQHPIARVQINRAFYYFIGDFVCLKAKLLIEVDGSIHAFQTEYDAARQQVIENFGYQVMRFTNEDVYYQLDSVLKKIEEVVLARLNMKARD